MKNFAIAVAVCIGLFIMSVLMTVGFVITNMNYDIVLKESVLAQQNKTGIAYDKLWKKIEQESQITKVSTATQKELVKSLVSGRQGSFIKMIQENNPNAAFSQEQFNRLSNVIASERDGFFREQTVLISKYQVYKTYRQSAIAGTLLSMIGRGMIDEPTLITSEETQDVMATGKDQNINLNLE